MGQWGVRVVGAACIALFVACGGKTNQPLQCDAPTTPCGEVCADLTKDGKNCGVCGHDCLDGACEAGVCKIATLYSNAAGAPYGIAVDAENVYFTTVKEGSVYKCPKLGCAGKVTTMAKGLSNPSDVQSDGKNIYFTTIFAIMTCPVDGCPASGPTVFADKQNAPAVIVLTSDRVWWTNHGSGGDSVNWCPIAGCGPSGPTVYADKQSAAEGLAVDGTNVFWTLGFTPGGSVQSCAIGATCAAPKTIAGKLDIPQSIASDGTNVYWTNFSGLSAMFCPVGGCPASGPTLLTSGTGWYDGIVLDASYVYFTGGVPGTSGDALLRCPKAGCGGAPTVIARGESKPGKIAVDASAIYWTASYTGFVSRVAK